MLIKLRHSQEQAWGEEREGAKKIEYYINLMFCLTNPMFV